MKLTQLLQMAGLLQFGLLLAGAAMPRAVGLKKHLESLPQFVRRLFWVYYGFIGFILASFGALTLMHASAMAQGDAFARTFCGFVAIFWLIRLTVAAFVFDVTPYLTSAVLRLGYWGMNIVFLYLPLVYGWAALRPATGG